MKPIDITNSPDLLRIAEEVRRTSAPLVLRRDREDVAIVMPLNRTTSPRRAKTKADHEAFLSSLGSWKDFDADRFLADNDESRRASSRPPVEL